MLLEHGASATTCDIHGNRALHFAARSGSLGAVQVLLEHGARALDENNFGEVARDSVKNHNALRQLLEDAETRETIASAARRKQPSPHPTPENSTER
jgi:ankyrin repeat protein